MNNALALSALMLGMAAGQPPSTGSSLVLGAGRNRGYCDCATPRPNRRRRCQSCYRDLPSTAQVEAPKIEPDLSNCPFYESLQVVSSIPAGEGLAHITLRDPGTDRCWMVRLNPEHFPIGWWTARVDGGSSDHMFAAFARALETPPDSDGDAP